jgi:hypothetical protein
MRSKALKDQKIEILEQRKEMKKQAMLQKTKINEAFEKMKNKGKLDPNIMTKLGMTGSTVGSPERQNKGSVRSQSPPEQYSRQQHHKGSVRSSMATEKERQPHKFTVPAAGHKTQN